jgi:tetratricopeptide (TPR) repeat protein
MDSLSLGGSRALCNACDAIRQVVAAYQLADSLEAAEREVRRWIRVQPTSQVPWHNLADILAQRGKLAEATDALQREAALDPAGLGSDRMATLAMLQVYAGEFEDAERQLRAAHATGSDATKRTVVWYLVLSNRQQGRLTEALAQAKQLRSSSDELNSRGPMTPRNSSPTVSVVEAQVLFEMGRYREAAALFDSISRWQAQNDESSQIGRSRAWWMTHGATALAAAGDTAGLAVRADSVQAFGARSAYGRDQRLHHHVRGLLFAARGDDSAAIVEFRRAIYSVNMGYTRTTVALATVLMRQRRWPEAIAVLQPALRSPLESSNYYVTRTELHDKLAQAWERMPGAAARDSAAAHAAIAAKAWARADPPFADRLARVRSRVVGSR